MIKLKSTIKNKSYNNLKRKIIYAEYYKKIKKIKKNEIVIELFLEENIKSSLYYLLLELCKKTEYTKYVIVDRANVKKMKQIIKNIKLQDVKVVIRYSNKYFKLLASAKYLINNMEFPEYFIKKEEQIYLNICNIKQYKQLLKNPQTCNLQRNFLMCDYIFCKNKEDFCKIRETYMLDQIYKGKYILYKDFFDEIEEKDKEEVSKSICDYILKDIITDKIKVIDGKKFENNKKNILIFAGSLKKNGITTALKGLINNIDLEKNNYFLTFFKHSISGNIDSVNQVLNEVKYIPVEEQKAMTITEMICQLLYFKLNINIKTVQKIIEKIYKREVKRNFSKIKFDYVIHYTGYERNFMHIFANMDAKRVIYAHSDISKEKKTRNNIHINSLKMAYEKYHKIVTIREGLIDETDQYIKELKNKKIHIAHNVNNIDKIKQKSLEPIQFDDDTYSNYSIERLYEILEDKNSIKFINVSRYSKEKGIERLINAFNKFNKEVKNSYLIIIGTQGKEFTKINSVVKKYKLKNVVLIKSLKNPFAILRKCDAFILSSYYEGLPMAIMEALILEKTVISTNITGPKEFLEQGYGYLVENSEEGIIEGMHKYKNGDFKDIKKFNAEEFNKKAIQEFYDIIK